MAVWSRPGVSHRRIAMAEAVTCPLENALATARVHAEVKCTQPPVATMSLL